MNATATPNRAFTLIELLIVIAVIGVLIALIAPALGRTKEQARRVQCLSNLRQTVTVFYFYADDYDRYPRSHAGGVGAVNGYVPRGASQLFKYGMAAKAFFCPSSYDIDRAAAFASAGRRPRPLKSIIISRSLNSYLKPGGSAPEDDGAHWYRLYTNPSLHSKPIPLTPDDPGDWVVMADITYHTTHTPGLYLANHTNTGTGWGTGGTTDKYSGQRLPKAMVAGGNILHNDASGKWKPFEDMHANYIAGDNRNYW